MCGGYPTCAGPALYRNYWRRELGGQEGTTQLGRMAYPSKPIRDHGQMLMQGTDSPAPMANKWRSVAALLCEGYLGSIPTYKTHGHVHCAETMPRPDGH